MPRDIVVLPTYNEREMLPLFLEEFARTGGECLVVDDSSPDGTGELADELARERPWLHVLHRPHKGGLGAAYRAGFTWALERGYERIGQMDCDLSHPPAALAQMHSAVDSGAGLVLGSRYVAGGGVRDWGLARRIISRGGCLYAQVILQLPVHDLTGGFKCFDRRVLEAISLADVGAEGYAFQIEMTYRARLLGFTVVEIPIIFRDRVRGGSKMSRRIVAEAAWRVPQLRWRALRGRIPRRG